MLQLILGGRVAVTGVGGDGSAYNARGSRVDRLAMPGAADAGGCRTLIADFAGPEFFGTVGLKVVQPVIKTAHASKKIRKQSALSMNCRLITTYFGKFPGGHTNT